VDLEQHLIEINKNNDSWNKKPLIREVYKDFYKLVSKKLIPAKKGQTLEIGSGIGKIKTVIPDCLTTDIFNSNYVEKKENIYSLNLKSNSIKNVILIDVFHHLRHPNTALKELHRVLESNGRVIIFEPSLSILSLLVYGVFHHEPLGLFKEIVLDAPNNWDYNQDQYYAAQGNAFRLFQMKEEPEIFNSWKINNIKRFSKFSYVTSGGFSKKQLYPDNLYPFMKRIDTLLDIAPIFFSTRMIAVLDKK